MKKEVIVKFIGENSDVANVKELFSKFDSLNAGFCSQIYFSNVYKSNINKPVVIEAEKVIEVVDSEPKVLLTSVDKINGQFDDSILVPIKSDTVLDTLVSINGGVMPATITVVPGESGAGKTTVLLDYFAKIAKTNPGSRLLYVSSEMNAIHVFKYSKRIDMTKVNIMLLSESDSPKEDFESVLKQGWDIVILDSLADTINKIRIATDWTEKATETWVLKYMDEIRRSKNDLKKFTAFLCTQHMTKGKEYSGSTNLKHMTDAMMNLLVDEKSQTETYIEYAKNRDGKKNIRLYFSINNEGVTYNEARFEKDNQIRAKISATRDALNKNETEFETFFLTQTPNETLDNPIEVVENQEAQIHTNNMQALTAENVPA